MKVQSFKFLLFCITDVWIYLNDLNIFLIPQHFFNFTFWRNTGICLYYIVLYFIRLHLTLLVLYVFYMYVYCAYKYVHMYKVDF